MNTPKIGNQVMLRVTSYVLLFYCHFSHVIALKLRRKLRYVNECIRLRAPLLQDKVVEINHKVVLDMHENVFLLMEN